jgi:mRNA interferase MazF
MVKEFDNWNSKKKEINENGENKYYHPRDIWWCKLGLNIGFEQDGKDEEFQRPVLIIFGFGKNTCIVVPLTTSDQIHKYRIPIGLVDGKEAKAIISQIKVVDTKRFVEKIDVLDKAIFSTIIKFIKDLL